jgi:hypothetical protein
MVYGLQRMRQKFGEERVQEIARDPNPEYDGIREALKIEQEEAENPTTVEKLWLAFHAEVLLRTVPDDRVWDAEDE